MSTLSEDSMFQFDVGTVIILDVGQDISAATLVEIIAKPPKGPTKTFTATLEGTTAIRYVTTKTAGVPPALDSYDIDEPGLWQLQAKIVTPTWEGRGAWASIHVKA